MIKKKGKELYDYQKADLERLFDKIENSPRNHNLLYQLPTGGGKTVIFAEIARRYTETIGKQVLILTHRVELSQQTCRMLEEFGVDTMVIDSQVKVLPEEHNFRSFVAMVETLNNRLNDKDMDFPDVGLVIVDEAHYNSFRKLFKFFDKVFILGVTATPLSSNIKLPMNQIYSELLVGHPISYLIANNYLSKANTYSYQVGLGTLKIGINGDYTVKSSELLYSNALMQGKLLTAYRDRAVGKKTLIFNNGINTSIRVYHTFKEAGYDVRHIDSTVKKKERKEILQWFKEKPNAILSSVGILTTGFDEPTIETIIINRATKSLTLYFQMIGRGSRILPNKKNFDVVDLGNNSARFGLWEEDIDWYRIFQDPMFFYDNLISDDQIERRFKYVMPDEVKEQFSNSDNTFFNVKNEYQNLVAAGIKPSGVIDKSIEQHAQMCIENSDNLLDAYSLSRLLGDEITYRVKNYGYCISNSTRNYRDWLLEDYKRRLRNEISKAF